MDSTTFLNLLTIIGVLFLVMAAGFLCRKRGIINDVANYRNYNEALGFTFRYFSTEMFKNGEIKLLAIDGVEPTLENIRNRRYPFITECCIITVKKRDENTQKIVKFMQSKAGQELTEKTGYTPILAE